MRRLSPPLLAVVLLIGSCVPASADITAFLGATTTPTNRQTHGLAAGAGLLIVAFEFEYSSTVEDVLSAAPSLKIVSGNGLLQTPLAIFGFQPYFTVGAGGFRERLGELTTTSVVTNVGGGVKVTLAGPLRLRVDYRAFKLGSSALFSPSHRIYAGLNLKF
jgi:hypothetical protein